MISGVPRIFEKKGVWGIQPQSYILSGKYFQIVAKEKSLYFECVSILSIFCHKNIVFSKTSLPVKPASNFSWVGHGTMLPPKYAIDDDGNKLGGDFLFVDVLCP